MTHTRGAVGWFSAAAVAGALHGAASLYWAAGGRWLLDTVGAWAVRMQRDSPAAAAALLLAVGLVKLIAAAVPVLNARGRLPGRRVWRGLSWAGGIGLVLYGGANMIAAWLALAGLFGPVEDRTSLLGHAFLWDPLFAIWGALLVTALIRSRPAARR